MINEAFQHCPGIGPFRLARIRADGVRTWQDALQYSDRIPASYRAAMIKESQRCLAAVEAGDIQYFIDQFVPKDKWRILVHYIEDATFFDIETLGLNTSDPVTVVVSWHRGEFRSFVEHENLDEFLHMLDQVKLLISFNGSTFDVPRVLNAFHVPDLPCPHLDLRWTAYHQGLSGGLKEIASGLGIERPADLRDVDGQQAVLLWQAWRATQEQAALEQLIRYCSADVLLLVMVAYRLIDRSEEVSDELWKTLPQASGAPTLSREPQPPKPGVAHMSGATRKKSYRSLLIKRWQDQLDARKVASRI